MKHRETGYEAKRMTLACRTYLASVLFSFGPMLSGCGQVKDAESSCAESAAARSAVEEIRVLELKGAQSNVVGEDRAEAEKMFGIGFISVDSVGIVRTREQVLQNYSSGKSSPWAKSFDVKKLDIRIDCRTAVTIGMAEALWVGAPDGSKPLNFGWLNVWIRSGKEWRLAATKFTKF
jgi:Domain of unknown function (DUF4440)